MLETFQSYDLMLQVYWALAIVSSLVFAVQAVGIFLGFDADSDLGNLDTPDVDDPFDADGFHLVSVKTVICFILGFGWTGVLFWDRIENQLWLGLLAALIGLVFMTSIAYLLYLILKFDRDNTFRVEKTIGKNADVYLRIAGEKANTGKVMVSLNGSVHELEALTEGETIETGDKVRIVGVVEGQTVLVEKI